MSTAPEANTPQPSKGQASASATAGADASPPTEQVAVGATAVAVPPSPAGVPASSRLALTKVARDLLPDELAQSGTIKLLVEEIYRVDAECADLKPFVKRYNDANTRARVLEERLRSDTALDIVFGVALSLGGALLGLAESFKDATATFLAIGALLIVTGIVAKLIGKWRTRVVD